MKLVVTRNISNELLEKIASVTPLEMIVSEKQEEIVKEVKDAEVLLLFWHAKHKVVDFFIEAEKLKWVHSVSAGVDHVLPHFKKNDVILTRSATTQNVAIAEHCLSLMLMISRQLNYVFKHVQQRRWERLIGDELFNHTVVILGVGFVGREIAKRCNCFGMTVIGVDLVKPSRVDLYRFYPISNLDEALKEADYLVVTLPLTKETAGLIGEKEFSEMKPGAKLVNVSRGGIVAEKAMIEALKQKRLAAAASDVFETEPLPSTSPLYEMENFIISPHMAGLTPYMVPRAVDLFCKNLRKYLNGEPLLHAVILERGF